MRHCEWGTCECEATETVAYPAVAPGRQGERSWAAGTEDIAFCPACAIVARAEVEDQYPRSTRRPLTETELARLANGEELGDLNLTCEGDYGYGPCGEWWEWADGRCARGHEIEVEEEGERR